MLADQLKKKLIGWSTVLTVCICSRSNLVGTHYGRAKDGPAPAQQEV